MNIVEFLEARIAEDEAAASAATSGPWVVDELGDVETVPEFDLHRFDITPETIAKTELRKEDGVHIARHDPARVLAECAAKRAIIIYSPPKTIQYLAAVYADHKDYDPAWSPNGG